MAKPTTTGTSDAKNKVQNGFVHKKKPGPKTPLPESTGKIAKRIRDIKRTLAKADVSLKAKLESERRLIQLKYLYGERKIDEKEREMAVKYHGVKHFERKKAHRKLKKIRHRIENTEDKDELAKLNENLQEALLDETYIENFPKTVPYASLYASNNDDGKRLSKKQEIRQEIQKAMENGNGFDDLQSNYRQKWRTTLIKQGVIEDVTPVMVEDESMVQADSKGEQDSELKDDFFE
ncbi:hypothetical protein BCR42DRAFT_451025 [Absidia repens]|uniref:rRNA-processing protein EFG1 n=1 Tax=Absidia repens TaxID=90262 RepID=A0A1X2III5_9FUNG|nr:hypothetical protein BCR42DRAFT_451025 [Absidia repens]